MTAKKIQLTAPVEWFGKPIDHVFLREPRAGDLMRFGEPRTAVHHTDGSGAVFFADRDEVIASYFERLLSLDGEKLVEGGAETLLARLSLEDGLRLRRELFAFFLDAQHRIAATKPTSSSSTSESSRSPSATP